jgi:hypothetical protein
VDPWIDPADLTAALPTISVAAAADAAAAATELLWALSGRQFGVLTETVRPYGCRRWPSWTAGMVGWIPLVGWGLPLPAGGPVGGMADPWTWWSGDGTTCGCGRTAHTELLLPAPVIEITEVMVDGAPLDPSAWMLRDRRVLARTDGGSWPVYQSPDMPADQPGTAAVTLTHGIGVPAAGQAAARTLAVELARDADPALRKDCRLPQRVTTLTRQGVTLATVDDLAVIDRGGTGIVSVDMWVRSVNPHHVAQPAAVLSPDTFPRFSHP